MSTSRWTSRRPVHGGEWTLARALSRRPALALAALALACLTAAPSALAQARPPVTGKAAVPRVTGAAPGTTEVRLYAYTFKHRRAVEALAVVQPLLSRSGSVELRPQDNTLVVRDTPAALTPISSALRAFDQPPRSLRFEVMIVQATRSAFSPVVTQDELPEPLLVRLKNLLPYSSYKILARTDLRSLEEERVTYELGEGFGLSFQPGRVDARQRLQLRDFQVTRRVDDQSKPLIHSSLNLRIAQPMTLALASAEASAKALVVVLTPSFESGDPEDH